LKADAGWRIAGVSPVSPELWREAVAADPAERSGCFGLGGAFFVLGGALWSNCRAWPDADHHDETEERLARQVIHAVQGADKEMLRDALEALTVRALKLLHGRLEDDAASGTQFNAA